LNIYLDFLIAGSN